MSATGPANEGKTPRRERGAQAADARSARAWHRLAADERARVRPLLTARLEGWSLPCREIASAYGRLLFVLAVTGAALSPEEALYLLVARWGMNTDPASVRRRLALAVQHGEVAWAAPGRYRITPAGIGRVRDLEDAWLARASRGGMPRRRSPQEEPLSRRDERERRPPITGRRPAAPRRKKR